MLIFKPENSQIAKTKLTNIYNTYSWRTHKLIDKQPIYTQFINLKMISILLVGFDNAGKSTLLANSRTLQPNEMTEILPTNGLSIERILLSNGTNAVVYDCSGGPRYREMWDFFCGECDGVVYVIDSTDRVRLSAVKENIEDFLQHPLLKKKPIAFLVNK